MKIIKIGIFVISIFNPIFIKAETETIVQRDRAGSYTIKRGRRHEQKVAKIFDNNELTYTKYYAEKLASAPTSVKIVSGLGIGGLLAAGAWAIAGVTGACCFMIGSLLGPIRLSFL